MQPTYPRPIVGTILLSWWRFRYHHPRAHAGVCAAVQFAILMLCLLAFWLLLMIPDQGFLVRGAQ